MKTSALPLLSGVLLMKNQVMKNHAVCFFRKIKPVLSASVSFYAFGVLLFLGSGAKAASLNVGDPAPPFKPGKWIQGDPVTEFSRDKVYLLEFWATSCGPCVELIPHLNGIAKKYKDKGLVVIGQNIWDQDESKLESFIGGIVEQ